MASTLICSVVAVRGVWRLEAEREAERLEREQVAKDFQDRLDRQERARLDAFVKAFENATIDVRLAMMETDTIETELSPMVQVIRQKYQDLQEVFSAQDETKFGPVLSDAWVKLTDMKMRTNPLKLIDAMIQSQEVDFNRLNEAGDFAENMKVYLSARISRRDSHEESIKFTQRYAQERQVKRARAQGIKTPTKFRQ